MEKTHVLSGREVKARVEIKFENYIKTKEIEFKTAINVARTQILPTLTKQLTLSANAVSSVKAAGLPAKDILEEVKRFDKLFSLVRDKTESLAKALEKAEARKSAHAKAEYLGNECEKALLDLREAVDSAEEFVAEELWPMAKYQDLLTVL